MNQFDQAVGSFFNSLANNCGNFFSPFFKAISLLGDYGIAFLAILVILCFFKKSRKAAIVSFVAIALGFLISNLLLKNLIARPRPFVDETSPYHQWWVTAGSMAESGYSFPSGHTTLATAFGVSLFLCLSKKRSWLFLFIPVLMGASRLYFVIHYATDVLGGLGVGLTVSLVSYFSIKWAEKLPKVRKIIY